MKKNIIFLSFLAVLTLFSTSCNRGTGCPAETAQAKTDKRGNFKATKTKHHLFPQKGKKKKKSRR